MAGGNNNQGGAGSGPNDKLPVRRIICSSIETEHAADLALKVDQAVRAIDRAARANRLNRRQQKQWLDRLWEQLDQFETELNKEILQPARNLVRDLSRGPKAQGEKLSVKKGKVTGSSEGGSAGQDQSQGPSDGEGKGKSKGKGNSTKPDTDAAGEAAPATDTDGATHGTDHDAPGEQDSDDLAAAAVED